MATVTDNFNRADAGSLGTASGGGTWTDNGAIGSSYSIVSNGAEPQNGDTLPSVHARLEVDLDTVNHYAQATVVVEGFSGGPANGVSVRNSAAAHTNYTAAVRDANCWIYRVVAGSPTELATAGTGFTVGDVLRLEVTGSGATVSLVLKKNGASVLTFDDTSGSRLTTGLRVGLSGKGGGRVDNFEGGDLAGGAATSRPAAVRRPLRFFRGR